MNAKEPAWQGKVPQYQPTSTYGKPTHQVVSRLWPNNIRKDIKWKKIIIII